MGGLNDFLESFMAHMGWGCLKNVLESFRAGGPTCAT